MEKPRKWSNNLRGLWRYPRPTIAPAIFVAVAFACASCFAGESAEDVDGEYGDISRNTLDLTKQFKTPALAQILPTLYTVKTAAKAGVRYDSNFNISPSAEADIIYTFDPSLYIGFGDVSRDVPQTGWDSPKSPPRSKARLLLGFTGMAGAFQKNSNQNYFDYDAFTRGGVALGKLTLDANAHFQRLSSPDLDLGRRVTRNVISGLLSAHYQLSQKSRLEADLSGDTKDYQEESDSDTETVDLAGFYDYRLSPKTHLAAGFAIGRLSSDDGTDEPYEQVLVRGSWQPDQKLALQIRTGVEFRQFNPGGRDAVNPVLEANASYRPEKYTRITLSASQRTTSTASQGDESAERTNVSLSLSQIFFQRLTVSASAGWQHSAYQTTSVAEEPNRTDNYTFTALNISYEFAKSWAVEANFQLNKNSSNFDEHDYDQNIAEIRVVFEL